MITNDFSWRVGGQSGEGIDSTGHIFAQAMARYGLQVYTYRTFPSRIRGGLTYYEIRATDDAIRARGDDIQYLVALGQETVDASVADLVDGGVFIWDSDAFEPEYETDKKWTTIPIPMSSIAEDIGNKIMRNMVSLGASAALLDMDRQIFYEFIEERFGRKGQKIVDMNKKVIDAGYEHVRSEMGGTGEWVAERRELPHGRRMLINGTQATAYGALVAGCRFIAGYPITPATDVLEWFSPKVDEYGGVVMQAEDEIAAINMVLGANYTGVRAMTSTSGPGLCLMTEAIGLSGMAEIPSLIVDVMRPGPSTGLPTKHSQADLMFAIHGGHDVFPRIVLSPSTTEEAFHLIQQGFNYAEQYQCPVFYLVDQDLGISGQTWDDWDVDAVEVDRGKLLTPEQVDALESDAFRRFEFTDDHVSNRSIPGQRFGMYLSAGSEHNEGGTITEDVTNRNRMMHKRLGKLDTFYDRNLNGQGPAGPVEPVQVSGPDDATLGVLTWGSTRHPVEEALQRMEAEDPNFKAKRCVLTHLWPFPRERVAAFLDSVDTVAVAEANVNGQLQMLTQMELGYHDKLNGVRKYDGTPFRPRELVAELQELI